MTFFAFLQTSLQYGLPSAGMQLHEACLHFLGVFMFILPVRLRKMQKFSALVARFFGFF